MKTIKGDITEIKSGIIVHQVNCQNRIGAGVAGAIIKKYPKVQKSYSWLFTKMSKEDIYCKYQPVPVTDDLTVINLFTQFYYGNPKKTGKIYTNTKSLVQNLKLICDRYPDKEIYIPERIGCGLGGADWDKLVKQLEPLRVTIVSLP